MNKKLVIITGASSGIGKATAECFSRAGYPLLLVARRVERLKKLSLPQTLCAKVDIRDRNSFARAIRKAEAKFGPADCLINNAGVMLLGNAAEQSPDEWKEMLDINVTGLLNGIHLTLKGMIERRCGTIINVSSVAGRKTFPNHAVYCGSKFAVHGITENIRQEVAGHNVRVMVVSPGTIKAELLEHTTSEPIKQGYRDWLNSIGGPIDATHVAECMLFAYQQPQAVCIREIVICPTKQEP